MRKEIFRMGLVVFCLLVGVALILNVKSVNAAGDESCEEGIVQGIQHTTNKNVVASQCLTHGINECEDFCKSADPASTVSFEKLCFAGLSKGTCCACLKTEESTATAATAPTPATAGGVAVTKIQLQNPLGANVGLFEIMGRVVKTFLGFVGALALMIFIYAGVSYMTAGGEASRVTKARDIMKYAVIGLALIVFAYAFVAFFLEAVTGQKF